LLCGAGIVEYENSGGLIKEEQPGFEAGNVCHARTLTGDLPLSTVSWLVDGKKRPVDIFGQPLYLVFMNTRYVTLESKQIYLLIQMTTLASSEYFSGLSRKLANGIGVSGMPGVFEKFSQQVPLHMALHQALWDGWTIAVTSRAPYTFELVDVLADYLLSIVELRQFDASHPLMARILEDDGSTGFDLSDVGRLANAFRGAPTVAPKLMYSVNGPQQEQ